jgi:RNA polymerase sigma-70 factor (ECF subfamily)
VVRDQLSDEALMASYQQGDTRAFELLLQRHRKAVFNFLFRQVGQRALAEDLLQEVFLRVIKGAESYRQTAKFTTWLYTIARNLCCDHARRAKHRRAASLDQPLAKDAEVGQTLGDRVAHRGPAVDRQVIGGQLRVRIEAAVEALSEEQREVFLMREYGDLSFREIAEIVGCPENTVKSRMRYALENLREQLAEYRDLVEAVQ